MEIPNKKLLLLFLITFQFAGFSADKLPLWTWDCINDRCVPSKATLSGKLQTLITCNMLCGSMMLWPQPTGRVSLSATAVPVRADLFHLQIISFPSRSVREHVREAFEIFRDVLRRLENQTRAYEDWRAVSVRVAINESGSLDPRLRLNTDESYRFKLRPKNGTKRSLIIDIFSNSFCGTRHAFETISQLIWLDKYAGSLVMLEAASVDDAPRFKYRGLMLDTARNFFPLNDVIRTIDGMAANKLNTFHWHVTDSQSFPLQLESIPHLAEYGSYGPGAVYTSDDVRTVSRHARLRGIRVLLEVDLPAHVGNAWVWSLHKRVNNMIHCLDSHPWYEYCNEPPCGQLNPRSVEVYEIIERLYAEITQLTGTDDIFHMGNDDVSQRCWVEQFNTSDPIDLWLIFTQNALHRLESAMGKLPDLIIFWASEMSKRIKLDLKDYVHKIGLQARDVTWTQKYVSGIRTVISHEDAWDLNSGYGSWYEETGGTIYNSWQRVYEHRPWSRKSIKCLEGGEATIWTSTLSACALDPRIWPRAAALAERLWSDRAEGATRPVYARLDIHRSRLKSRGIQVSPLWSTWCTHNPYTC
ncbi:probable beta-hexosaminidase fdl [Colias croceus]|uniref:probable beta-hexosaminidase fdl n=1 Tax=Colias crocea TaxID=72248 RepID=UPI001E28074A|nr:probable beta-hexosaminidase fdl [Colias croceus]